MLPWRLQHPPTQHCASSVACHGQQNAGPASKPACSKQKPGACQRSSISGWALGMMMWDPADQRWAEAMWCSGSCMGPHVLLDHVR